MIRGSLSGQRFGMLTVEGIEGQNDWRESRYWCRCDCGRRTAVWAGNLRSGHTRSCGDTSAHFAMVGNTAARYPAILRNRPQA
jgi:hypothetical protein